MDLKTFSLPFPADFIEWRIGESGLKKNGEIWAKCFAYVQNRAIQDRLDDVVGPENWRNEFCPIRAGEHDAFLCGIAIKIDGEWVTKWDGSELTDFEPVKGGLSASMKRAAVQWGIGRYLYDLPPGWADVNQNGKFFAKTKDGTGYKWNPPELPKWALPKDEVPQPRSAQEANRQAAPPQQVDKRKPEREPGEDDDVPKEVAITAFHQFTKDIAGLDNRALALKLDEMIKSGGGGMNAIESNKAAQLIGNQVKTNCTAVLAGAGTAAEVEKIRKAVKWFSVKGALLDDMKELLLALCDQTDERIIDTANSSYNPENRVRQTI